MVHPIQQPASRQPLRCGIYIRMSSKRQEDSPDRQRMLCYPYLETRGYRKIAEEVDNAISGDEFKKRKGFQRLLQLAAEGKLDVILCDEPSRLSRQDAYDFIGTVVNPLRAANVELDTVKNGPQSLDPSNLPGLLMLVMQQVMANEYLKKLSRDSLSGMLRAANAGKPTGSRPPWGYGREKKLNKDDHRDRPRFLIPEQAKIVLWMFETVDKTDASSGVLSRELNRRGVKPPMGGVGWRRQTIDDMLTNPNYTDGEYWGRVKTGKHFQLAGTDIQKVDNKQHATTDKPETEWIRKPGKHAFIVPQDLFDRVQAKLANKNQWTNRKTGDDGYLLSGMLVCGHCGRNMQGRTMANGTIAYRCNGNSNDLKAPCPMGHPSISERDLLRHIHRRMAQGWPDQKTIDAYLEQLAKKQEALSISTDPQEIVRLTTAIAKAQRNLARCDDDEAFAAVDAEIREMKLAKAQLECQLRNETAAVEAIQNTIDGIQMYSMEWVKRFQTIMDNKWDEIKNIRPAHADLDAERKAATDEISMLMMEAGATHAQHRQALQQWIKQITLYWQGGVVNVQHRCKFVRGTIETACGDLELLDESVDLPTLGAVPEGTREGTANA